jgi:hypothetical protein
MSVADTWGTQPSERALPFPCDGYLDRPHAAYYRGITVQAPPATLFRWLCQLRAAPYSYDWIDNGGRRSPQLLTPGLDDLAVGQPVMRIFRLAAFEPGRHLTLLSRSPARRQPLLGELAVTYLVVPQSPERCRLLVKLAVRYPRGFRGLLMRRLLPWGDLLMMRRQLLNLKRLAERDRDH